MPHELGPVPTLTDNFGTYINEVCMCGNLLEGGGFC